MIYAVKSDRWVQKVRRDHVAKRDSKIQKRSEHETIYQIQKVIPGGVWMVLGSKRPEVFGQRLISSSQD